MTKLEKEQELELLPSVLNGELRSIVLELWQQTRMDWSFATDTLAKVFRRERWLGSSQRRFISELLYNLIRHARRIDFALEHGGLQSVGKAPDSSRLLACLVLEHGLSPSDALHHNKDVNWNKVAQVDEKISGIRKDAERIAVRHSLPDFLSEILVADLGGESAENLAAALNRRAPMSIRVNTLKKSREELQKDLEEEGIETSFGKYGSQTLHVETRTNIFGLQTFKNGCFEAQDEGSQLIAELVAPPPKGLIVDYCAGAGGKSLALAAMLGNRGRILASDVGKRKLKELRRRAKRAGVGNIQVVELNQETGTAFPKPFESMVGKACRVLVDAPCTGIGALRRNPESRWRLSEADLKRLPEIQLEIASRAMELVAPNGRLIYATCTLLKQENQKIVEALMKGRDDLEIISPIEIWGRERGQALVDESGQFLLTNPHRHGSDGFFAAVIRRKPISK